MKSFVNKAGTCKSRELTAPAGHVDGDMMIQQLLDDRSSCRE